LDFFFQFSFVIVFLNLFGLINFILFFKFSYFRPQITQYLFYPKISQNQITQTNN